jgi:hypothetical protein
MRFGRIQGSGITAGLAHFLCSVVHITLQSILGLFKTAYQKLKPWRTAFYPCTINLAYIRVTGIEPSFTHCVNSRCNLFLQTQAESTEISDRVVKLCFNSQSYTQRFGFQQFGVWIFSTETHRQALRSGEPAQNLLGLRHCRMSHRNPIVSASSMCGSAYYTSALRGALVPINVQQPALTSCVSCMNIRREIRIARVQSANLSMTTLKQRHASTALERLSALKPHLMNAADQRLTNSESSLVSVLEAWDCRIKG